MFKSRTKRWLVVFSFVFSTGDSSPKWEISDYD